MKGQMCGRKDPRCLWTQFHFSPVGILPDSGEETGFWKMLEEII
jgi:hypothetical protein